MIGRNVFVNRWEFFRWNDASAPRQLSQRLLVHRRLQVRQHLLQRIARRLDFRKQRIELALVRLGQRGKWIESEDQLLGFLFGNIEY